MIIVKDLLQIENAPCAKMLPKFQKTFYIFYLLKHYVLQQKILNILDFSTNYISSLWTKYCNPFVLN